MPATCPASLMARGVNEQPEQGGGNTVAFPVTSFQSHDPTPFVPPIVCPWLLRPDGLRSLPRPKLPVPSAASGPIACTPPPASQSMARDPPGALSVPAVLPSSAKPRGSTPPGG